MDLKLLREATRPEHEATEAAVDLMHPELTRDSYVAVLQRFHGVVCAWDEVASAEAPAALADLVRQRMRCSSLEADLRFFNAPLSQPVPRELVSQIRKLIGTAADGESQDRNSRFLGAMYVLEGSTLGGQYIAHTVESALNLQSGVGDAFFRGYGKDTMPRWREFQQVLATTPDSEAEAVIGAAKQMFAIFRVWMSGDSTAMGMANASAQQNAQGAEREAS